MTRVHRQAGRAIGVLAIAIGLSACVLSEKPLVTAAIPISGDRFNVTLFRDFANGRAQTIDQRHYAWNGSRYVATWSEPRGETRLMALQLGEDVLVQRTDGAETIASYWIARPIFAGAYFVFPVDENALSSEDRSRICASEGPEGLCLIKSYEQLLEVAKATARVGMPAKPGLAILSGDVTN